MDTDDALDRQLAATPWHALDVAATGAGAGAGRRVLLVKMAGAEAYAARAVFADAPHAPLFETLGAPAVAARVATTAPAFRRNPPRKLVALIRRLLTAAPEFENVAYSASWMQASLVLLLSGSLNGLVFQWKMILDPLDVSNNHLSDVGPASDQLLSPLIASVNVLFANQERMSRMLAEKDKEIEELRSALVNNANNLGGIVRVKKTTPQFSATQVLQDSMNQIFPISSTPAQDITNSLALSLFRKREMEDLYKNIMAQFSPQQNSTDVSGDKGDEDDLLHLDYAPDGGSTQRIVGGINLGAIGEKSQQDGSTQSAGASQKTKKEEAEEIVDKRLKELLELGQKKEAAAATASKPKKRKII